jgi:hypothetical protein
MVTEADSKAAANRKRAQVSFFNFFHISQKLSDRHSPFFSNSLLPCVPPSFSLLVPPPAAPLSLLSLS